MTPHFFTDRTDTTADTGDFLRQNTQIHPNISVRNSLPLFPNTIFRNCESPLSTQFRAGGGEVAEQPSEPTKNCAPGAENPDLRREVAMRIVSRKSLMERVTVARCGCWIWDGARSKEGYGVLRLGDSQRPAHRFFWETFVGPIPEGYTVRSRKLPVCVGKTCCNPAHHRLQGPVVQTTLSLCKEGHLLTPDNVVIENRKGRQFKRCRTCRREAWRNWQKQHTPQGKTASCRHL